MTIFLPGHIPHLAHLPKPSPPPRAIQTRPAIHATPTTVLTSIISTTHHIVPQSPKNDTLSPTSILSSHSISSAHMHVNGNDNLPHPAEPSMWKVTASLPRPGYRPAYELLDGNLERCGRGFSVGLNRRHAIST